MKDNNPIVVQQLFDLSAQAVWKAITDVSEMRKWYFENIPDFRAEIGFETRFPVQSGDRIFTHIWKVVAVVPQKIIGYSWNFEAYSGESYTTFELTEKGFQTVLTVKSFVVSAFPDDIPEFKRESGQAGWDYLIKKSLKGFLEK